MIRCLFAAVLLVSSLGLGGCIIVGTDTETRPTTGQELTDLKTALDRGAINQQEYDKQRTAILARHNN